MMNLLAYWQSVKSKSNFKSYVPEELGEVLLVKLNGIFLQQMMSAGAFALWASGLMKLTQDAGTQSRPNNEKII